VRESVGIFLDLDQYK